MLDLEILKKKLEESIAPLGYTIYEIKFHIVEKEKLLSIVVDHEEEIDLNRISEVSDILSKKLDELDPIEEAYTLDVSSLGAEKPIALDKLDKYKGKKVNLHLSHPYKGENYLEGILKDVSESEVTLTIQVKAKKIDIILNRLHIDKARLAV